MDIDEYNEVVHISRGKLKELREKAQKWDEYLNGDRPYREWQEKAQKYDAWVKAKVFIDSDAIEKAKKYDEISSVDHGKYLDYVKELQEKAQKWDNYVNEFPKDYQDWCTNYKEYMEKARNWDAYQLYIRQNPDDVLIDKARKWDSYIVASKSEDGCYFGEQMILPIKKYKELRENEEKAQKWDEHIEHDKFVAQHIPYPHKILSYRDYEEMQDKAQKWDEAMENGCTATEMVGKWREKAQKWDDSVNNKDYFAKEVIVWQEKAKKWDKLCEIWHNPDDLIKKES